MLPNPLYYLALLCGLIFSPALTAAPEVDNDEERVLDLARNYVFELRNYINASADDADYFLLELYQLIEGSVFYHYNDLPGDESYRQIEFHRYFSLIDERYRNELKMEETDADEIELIDCVEQKNGDIYYTVTFPKRLVYRNRESTVTNVVKIKMVGSRPLIDIIGMPEHIPLPEACTRPARPNTNQLAIRAKIERYTQSAEGKFAERDYVAAKEQFEAVLTLQTDAGAVNRVRERIADCQKRLDAGQFNRAGDVLFAQRDYAGARDYYLNSLTYDPSAEEVRQKVRTCEENIANFQRALTAGDRYLAAKDYRSAKSSYQRALAYQPDYLYCKNRIAECQREIDYPQRVANELAEARSLRDRRKHLEALRIFNRHKSSGKLTARDFYYLGKALYANVHGIQRKFGYGNQKEALGIAANYLHRASCNGDRDARRFLNETLSLRLRKLLKPC